MGSASLTIMIVVVVCASLTAAITRPASAACIGDEDWPDKPCLDTPPYSEEYIKSVWQEYYEFKGRGWMEEKRAEMNQAIANETLRDWIETRNSPSNFANHNVWYYYHINDEAPDVYVYGKPTAEQLEILKQLCLGPVRSHDGANPCDRSAEAPINFDTTLTSLFAGASVAIVVGLVIATRVGKTSSR